MGFLRHSDRKYLTHFVGRLVFLNRSLVFEPSGAMRASRRSLVTIARALIAGGGVAAAAHMYDGPEDLRTAPIGSDASPSSIFGTGGGAGGGSDCSEHSDMLLCAPPGILPGVALDAPFAPSLTRVQNLPEMRGVSETVSHLIPNVERVALPLACVRAALAAVCS